MKSENNQVRLTGHAGSEPIVNNFADDKKVARVSIAVNEDYKTTSGNAVKKTQWFTLVFWNGKADEAIKLINKGTKLSIEGQLNMRVYEAKDGTKRQAIEINVDTLTVAEMLQAQ